MRDEGGAVAVLGLSLLGLTSLGAVGALIYVATREPEELPPEEEEEEEVEEVEEIIDAEFRSGYVWWEGLETWRKVYTRYINEWPADTDVTFVWEIKNIGNVGAYFQVYLFEPGSWMYLDPGEKLQVFEEAHTLAIPVTPGYQFARITILGRDISGERIGAVWTSDEFEIIYS
jgi:hypothetical protein